jgi:hypothetical protein
MGLSFEPEIYSKALSAIGARYEFQWVLALSLKFISRLFLQLLQDVS